MGVSGCSADTRDGTRDVSGFTDFRFLGGCFLECGLDQPVLRGATVKMIAINTKPRELREVRVRPESMATVASTPRCGEDTCSVEADVQTHVEGDAQIELVNAQGQVVGRDLLRVRSAARIDLTVNGAQHAGAYEIALGETLHVTAAVIGRGERRLITGTGALQEEWDESFLERVPIWWDSRGFKGLRAGETLVTFRTGEISASLVIRVR
jgi:hypothetical protein